MYLLRSNGYSWHTHTSSSQNTSILQFKENERAVNEAGNSVLECGCYLAGGVLHGNFAKGRIKALGNIFKVDF
jgi:hypothetical protein